MNPEEGNFLGVPCFALEELRLYSIVLRYQALGGDAGVSRYQMGTDSITVQFKDGSSYLYTYASAGKTKIEAMKKHATKGEGLTTYINQHVRDRYAAKLG
jgi:hypothetical protein